MKVEDEAVKAARRIRDTAMKQIVAARIPESGHFGAIAQDADWLVDHLSPDPVGVADEGQLPTRAEAAAAAKLLLRCNGFDLDQWGGGDLMDDFPMDALKALASHKPAPSPADGEYRSAPLTEERAKRLFESEGLVADADGGTVVALRLKNCIVDAGGATFSSGGFDLDGWSVTIEPILHEPAPTDTQERKELGYDAHGNLTTFGVRDKDTST